MFSATGVSGRLHGYGSLRGMWASGTTQFLLESSSKIHRYAADDDMDLEWALDDHKDTRKRLQQSGIDKAVVSDDHPHTSETGFNVRDIGGPGGSLKYPPNQLEKQGLVQK